MSRILFVKTGANLLNSLGNDAFLIVRQTYWNGVNLTNTTWNGTPEHALELLAQENKAMCVEDDLLTRPTQTDAWLSITADCHSQGALAPRRAARSGSANHVGLGGLGVPSARLSCIIVRYLFPSLQWHAKMVFSGVFAVGKGRPLDENARGLGGPVFRHSYVTHLNDPPKSAGTPPRPDTVVRITRAHIAAERHHRSTQAFDDAPELLNAVALALNDHLCAVGMQTDQETLGRVFGPGAESARRSGAVVSIGEFWRPAPAAVTAYCRGRADSPFRFDLLEGAGWSVSVPDDEMRRTLFGGPADAPHYRIGHRFPLSGRLHELTAIGGSSDNPILIARLVSTMPERAGLFPPT